jgi:hypothetical protein
MIINKAYIDEKGFPRALFELKEDELYLFKLIGSGVGVSFNHCLIMARKHVKDFPTIAVGYRLVPNLFDTNVETHYYEYEFYERRPEDIK